MSNWWRNLSDTEKYRIANEAREAHDKSGRTTCYWCGAKIVSNGYDFTSSAKDPREICKGYCRQRRFFDDPVEEMK